VTAFYLDTSVAVHVFQRTPTAAVWFDEVTADPNHQLVSSRILRTELTRYLRREDVPVAERDTVIGHLALVDLTEGILINAEAIQQHIRTLDAIHLASALAVGSPLVVATHDARLGVVSAALGLETMDPVA
jgi:predicted nucleic acid-binding protein